MTDYPLPDPLPYAYRLLTSHLDREELAREIKLELLAFGVAAQALAVEQDRYAAQKLCRGLKA